MPTQQLNTAGGRDWATSYHLYEVKPPCDSPDWLSPAEIYQCLRGTRTFIMGDSMIRPLLGRLIAYLRGAPQYLDHLYHQPGGYYAANGTNDVFVELEFLPSLHKAVRMEHPAYLAPQTPEDDWDPSRTMEFQFYWAAHFDRFNMTDHGILFPAISEHFGVLDGASMLIAGPMYHEGGNYDNYRARLLEFFKVLSERDKRIPNFVWIATVPKPVEPWDMYNERNRQMKLFVQTLNERSLAGVMSVPRRSFFVDADRMARPGPDVFGPVKPADGNHFQCNKHGPYPGMMGTDPAGMAPDNNCQDIFNLNVMQSVLKVMCNK
ncbi:hypothetical protein TSOC_005101 [Tetrabaena socialis]|uniref:Uncharacterized protein n=1 Tax=Tetrabaena socialis TaxID=47790 RepID=A0A2J8A7B1_9CHLO|nr:hypothetical protein TSOC_005101 [Tetrabaena socialis]|eukprot:PNH08363.1 hypothetical protein TSOC_005101 [Tetrabaena socialis]